MRALSSLAPTDFAGVDISLYQRGIDIAGIAQEYPLIVLKASEGATITDPYLSHFEAHTREVPYRGFYHFLTHTNAAAQAARFISSVSPYFRPDRGDFLVVDWETAKWTDGLNYEISDEIAREVHRLVSVAFPQKPVWWYCYRSLAFRERNQGTPLYPLWLASYDVIEDAYALGAIIDQYGVADSLLPWYGGDIDVNRVLDPTALHALVYPSTDTQENEVELTTPITIKEHDAAGNATTDYATNVGATFSFIHDAAERAAARAATAIAKADAALAKADVVNGKLDALLSRPTATTTGTIDYDLLAAKVADVLAARLGS